MLGADEGRVLGFQTQAGTAPGNSDIQTLKSLDQAFSSTIVVVAPVDQGPTPTTVMGRRSAPKDGSEASSTLGRLSPVGGHPRWPASDSGPCERGF